MVYRLDDVGGLSQRAAAAAGAVASRAPLAWILEFALKARLDSVLRRLDDEYPALQSEAEFNDKELLIFGRALNDLLSAKQARCRKMLQDGRTLFNIRRMIFRFMEEHPSFLFPGASSSGGAGALSRDDVLAALSNLDAILAVNALREEMQRHIEARIAGLLPNPDPDVVRCFGRRRRRRTEDGLPRRSAGEGRTIDALAARRRATIDKVRAQAQFGKSRNEHTRFVTKLYKECEETLRALAKKSQQLVCERPTTLESFVEEELEAATRGGDGRDGSLSGGTRADERDGSLSGGTRGDGRDGSLSGGARGDERDGSLSGGALSALTQHWKCGDGGGDGANTLASYLRAEVRCADDRDNLLTETGLMALLDRFHWLSAPVASREVCANGGRAAAAAAAQLPATLDIREDSSERVRTFTLARRKGHVTG